MSITKTREFFSLPNVHYAQRYVIWMKLDLLNSLICNKIKAIRRSDKPYNCLYSCYVVINLVV